MLVVVLATVGWVIVAGLFSFSWAQAFDFPPEAQRLDAGLLRAIGAGGLLAMYNYGGYNNVCNIGEEIRDAGADAAARDRAVDRDRRGALHRDEHGDPRHDAVARSAADAHDRVAVHRADVRGSGERPHRRRSSMTALILFVTASSLYAVDPRLLADPVRRGARRPVLQRLRRAAPDQAFPARVAADDRRGVDSVLLLHARAAGELADPGADPAAVRLAMRGGDPAAPLPAGHRQAVQDVAVSAAGARLAGDVDLHLLSAPLAGIVFSAVFLAASRARRTSFSIRSRSSRSTTA